MIIHEVSNYIQQDNIPRPQFYVQNILPKKGSMLLYGAPGVKKSFLVQYMAFCIATGTPFLDMPTEQGRVILVNFEISPYGYFWRLRDMGSHFALQENMLFEASPSITYLEERENFDRFAADIRPIHPQVMILDCLQACYGGEENNTREMSVFIMNMAELMTEHDASLVLVHHSNKNLLAANSMDRSRGTTKLPGWVDSVVYMVNQPGGIQLQFAKTRQATRELPNINIAFNNFVWTVR